VGCTLFYYEFAGTITSIAQMAAISANATQIFAHILQFCGGDMAYFLPRLLLRLLRDVTFFLLLLLRLPRGGNEMGERW
jgi:hypothetical protein